MTLIGNIGRWHGKLDKEATKRALENMMDEARQEVKDHLILIALHKKRLLIARRKLDNLKRRKKRLKL